MDPISFTASLITVSGLVAASSIKIHDLLGKLKTAPKDVKNLLEQIRTFEGLLEELQMQLQDHQNSVPPQETLQKVWGSSLAQMQEDVQSLQMVVSKVEPLLGKETSTSRILLLACQILNEKEVEKYQRKIDTHCGTLTSIQAMVCGRKLDKLSQSIIQRSDEDKNALRTVSSQLSQSTGQLSTEVKAGLSTVSSLLTGTESANGARHQTLLTHLNDHAQSDNINAEKMDDIFQQQIRSIDVNEAGFQAVQSSLMTASSSSSEEHKTTHAMISQCQGQMQQILRSYITFGMVAHGEHSPSIRSRALRPTITETTVFWNYYSHHFPIGMLQIRLKQTRKTGIPGRAAPKVRNKSELAVEFVPPRWLSNVVINYSMKLSWDLIDSQWRWGATLKPLKINEGPFFINALTSLDVEGVRASFATGLAEPTDHILGVNGFPVPWFCGLRVQGCHGDWVPRMSMMLHFMVKNGVPGQEWILCTFSICLRNGDQELLRNHLQDYIEHGRATLGTQSSALKVVVCSYRICRIDWISDFLFKSSEPWLLDDLSSLDICLIGTFAHVNALFRDRLKKELVRYQSPAMSGQTFLVDNLFETTFGIASIESHFHTLIPFEIFGFLSLCCRTCPVSIMKPLIDIGIGVLENDRFGNILGQAAAAGNIDVVCLLLEAGGNSSLALPDFLSQSNNLSDALFKRLLKMLVENARPTSFWAFYDPLLAVIESSRALHVHPKAPEILLERQVFTDKCFGKGASRVGFEDSYMYQAISRRNAFMVDLLLQNGAHAHAQISHSFHCYEEWFKQCTWITFSVMSGAASCADILIQHGADVTALDGTGMSAIQLAKINVCASHPRKIGCYRITAEDDAEVLAVVERAFKLKFQGTGSLDDHIKISDELTLQPRHRQNKFVSTLRNHMAKVLGVIFTPTQIRLLHDRLRGLYHDIRKLWCLSFREALLMRSIYVVSYALLLVLEITAFVKGHKCIRMPSRFLLSAVALLLLGLLWGSSQIGLSWVSITA